MPVFNGEKYLAAAIDSILAQSFRDFEFIIVNDCSTDRTKELIKSFNDPRMVLIDNPAQFGVSKSLNIGIESARGEYIARNGHADDISLPDRLKDQVAYMDKNPSLGISGAWARTLDRKNGTKGTLWKKPETDDEIKALMVFACPFLHPTVIMRRETLNTFNLRYDENFKSAQDYDLWSRAMNNVKFGNLQKAVLQYRLHENSITSTKSDVQHMNSEKVRVYLSKKFGVDVMPIDPTLDELESWLLRLRDNSKLKDYCYT